MELLRTQFAGSQKVHLHLWFSWVIQKSGGEKQWNAYVVGETYKTNWQTEKSAYKRRCETPVDGTVIPFGADIYLNSISSKDTSRLHQVGPKMLPGIFIGNALNSGGGWTGDVLIADWQDIENQFKSKEVGIKKLQEAFTFPCAEGSLRQEGHAQRQTFRHQRVESLDAGGVPSTLGEARSDPLQCVRDISLQEEESQTFLKLIATPWKQKKMSGVCLEKLFITTMSCPENTCMYRKSYHSHHSQFRQNTLKS